MHKQISAPPAPPQIQLSLLSNLSQGIVLCWEQSLQKSSESESSVMVVGKCEWTTYMPYGGGRNNTDASKLLHKDFSKNMWIIISFFFRDEIEIFIISLFETRSRFVPSISRASRRDRDLYLLYLVLRDEIENLLYQILNFEKGTRNKKGFLVIEREFSLLILTRFFEIENSRQCLSQALPRPTIMLWTLQELNT